MRSEQELDGVSLLGNTGVKYPTQYVPEVLETFVNKAPRQRISRDLHLPESSPRSAPRQARPDLRR